ncbi:MAG: hypothetical protein Q8L26_07975 [Candidatus Omnitrophota bacterium]|nr:hypothetical protein [Candidatus Omnitrophota bacterium]
MKIKRIFNWQVFLCILLIALSALVYFIHYLVFRDLHHILIYLIGDIAFVFIEVMLVTLVLHQLLHYREKRVLLNKLNMVIGTFFTEVGTELLRICSAFDQNTANVTQYLVVNNDWSDKEFARVKKHIEKHEAQIDSKKNGLGEMKKYLVAKRQFLLNLLENPNLLEHESFTDLLWAVFHLTDELAYRIDFSRLPETDYQHLSGDIKRAYYQLTVQWLAYMKHLKQSYPYLFSLAMRTNPFDPNAKVEVGKIDEK